MASLFGSSLPSYSQEQLGVHLGSLQTLAVRLPEHHETEIVSVQEVPDVPTPSPALQAALHELTQSKPPSLSRLAALLDDIVAKSAKAGAAAATVSAAADVDRAAEAEVLSRAVTLLWAHTMQVFVDGALALEDDRTWWNMALASRFGTVVYLIQSEL
jgi:hypothetical protein